MEGVIFLWVISLWGVVVSSSKIAINLTGTYFKLHCKGAQRVPTVKDRQTQIILLLYKDYDLAFKDILHTFVYKISTTNFYRFIYKVTFAFSHSRHF